MAVIMEWLQRSRLRARPASEARRLVHPPSALFLSLATLLLFAGMGLVALSIFLINPNPPEDHAGIAAFGGYVLVVAIFALFTLFGAAGVIAYFLEEYRVSEEGLYGKNFIGAAKGLRWRDLRSVRYSAGMKWFRMEAHTGSVVHIYATLMGLPELAQLCLRHAPAGAIDAEALNRLRATAKGNPPPL